MDSNPGKIMYGWASDLFPVNRSITGNGLSETLSYISSILPGIVIHNVATGTRAFDWTIPNEWTINDAFIADMAGKKLISISENNLHVVGYSAQTKPANLRDVLETKLEKKRKNLLGPPSGKKMFLFIDDLNMPALETYGAQPPNELLRQVIDQGGFYDVNKLYF